MSTEYIPYSEEWQKEMMKLNKPTLISMVKKHAKANKELTPALKDAIALLTELHNNGHIPEAYKKQLGEFFINGGIAVQKATE